MKTIESIELTESIESIEPSILSKANKIIKRRGRQKKLIKLTEKLCL